MPKLTVIIGDRVEETVVEENYLLGDAIAELELPLEQPCAGRGTCGKCKVLADSQNRTEAGLHPPDDIEREHLTAGELAVGNRLACRARIATDARVVLAPVVVYSNKSFRASNRYRKERDVPLGLAIDLGSTTVAAFLTMLDNGEVCAGAASLNQQTVFGADVISRLASAKEDPADAGRLHRLALSSINQAIDSLKLSNKIRQRIERAVIVCNPAMHHLLAELPVYSLSVTPFQPYSLASMDTPELMTGLLPDSTRVSLPPLIGGFVGSDALACLAYFDFDRAPGPMAAIDLGTNGEVLVTDGERILVGSTAAGPAFEGVNISCGSRAVDGAITRVGLESGDLSLETINDESPVGLTGSGLLSAVHVLREAGVIEANGRISPDSSQATTIAVNANGRTGRAIPLTPDGELYLSQWDIRELQKAKGAIRATIDILMRRLDLEPEDMQRVILTGSFGGQIDVDAARALGLIPPVPHHVIENIPNGAGLGAASFLTDEGYARGVRLAEESEQIDLDTDLDFIDLYVRAMALEPGTD